MRLGIHDDHLFGLLERPLEHCSAHAVGRARLRVVTAPVHDAGRRLAPEAVNVDDGKAAARDAARNHPREDSRGGRAITKLGVPKASAKRVV